MKYDLLIQNGNLVIEHDIVRANIGISSGKIVAVELECELLEADKRIDAAEKYVFPGFVDPHVHLNDPGMTNSEDFYTGTCAAVAGGITTVLEHPLTFPLPDNLNAFEQKKQLGLSKAISNFCLFGAFSPGKAMEIGKIIDAGAVAFKTFLVNSPEIPMLSDGELLEYMTLLSKYDIVLVVHCENNDIVEYNTKKQQVNGRIKYSDYPDGRPEIAELEAVKRICFFAEKTGCKVNIAHCSLPEAVQIVNEAKSRKVNVSVETCPQYLILNELMLDDLGVYGICNPPLRSKKNTDALWECLLRGEVDFLCSDHATYTIEEKMVGTENVFLTPAGVTGIETVFQLIFSEGVVKRNLPVAKFVELCATNAAKRFNLYPRKGRIAVGADADIVIFNPDTEWILDEKQLKQMIKWSPYHKMHLKGKVETTIVNGKIVYDKGCIQVERGSGDFVSPHTVG